MFLVVIRWIDQILGWIQADDVLAVWVQVGWFAPEDNAVWLFSLLVFWARKCGGLPDYAYLRPKSIRLIT